jgi:hypothetical protein
MRVLALMGVAVFGAVIGVRAAIWWHITRRIRRRR